MSDLLALFCDVYCDFVTFSLGILGQVWCLIVWILDPCCLSYFMRFNQFMCLKDSRIYVKDLTSEIYLSISALVAELLFISNVAIL